MIQYPVVSEFPEMGAGMQVPDMEMGEVTGNETQKLDFVQNLSESNLRLGFIRKVYAIVGFQLTLTTVICALPFYMNGFREFQLIYWPLLLVSFIGVFAISILFMCVRSLSKQTPINYILLTLFTLFEAYTVSFVCSFTDPQIVILAFACTAGVTIALTIYAFTTPTDFTCLGAFTAVITFSMLTSLITWFIMPFSAMDLLVSILIVMLYSVYLIYDTQIIVGGRHQFQLSLDDYIIGAFVLYVDIIILFLRILRVLAILFKKN